jgi:hypothetical protein
MKTLKNFNLNNDPDKKFVANMKEGIIIKNTVK